MTTTRRATMAAIGALGAGAALTGSALAVGEHEDDERAQEETDDEVPDAVAAVRIAHFSPDAPAIDVYVDGEQVLQSIAYDEVSPYLEVEPGTADLTITAAGDSEAVVFEDSVYFGRAFYTVAAIGELEGETFNPLILTDAGSSLVRLVHASPDAPAVDVVGNDGAMDLFENVSFGSATNYVALPAGSYALDVLPAADGNGEPDAGGEAPEYDSLEEADTGDDGADVGGNESETYENETATADNETATAGNETASVGNETTSADNETETGTDGTGVDDEPETGDGETATEDDGENGADDSGQADEAVASFEVTLEQGGAYTVAAIGYLEGTEGDAAFDVTVTEDGPMAVLSEAEDGGYSDDTEPSDEAGADEQTAPTDDEMDDNESTDDGMADNETATADNETATADNETATADNESDY
ncbi:hypothetical protein HALLA_08125 [Halostagnicola larsenii XH-48]|uniref:DUF4397 domain-containing protein n=1 Tax=Halostagnicola larsenii XH-48 TaxID=797299 RepID=W0JNV5_9EURY|nr:DUF4397 domain-containing protein [Halostagnicola larsenii]AHF98834.1 hypothetical protein HALLA_08125 [Halostagnicola larsenii XH-48]